MSLTVSVCMPAFERVEYLDSLVTSLGQQHKRGRVVHSYSEIMYSG